MGAPGVCEISILHWGKIRENSTEQRILEPQGSKRASEMNI